MSKLYKSVEYLEDKKTYITDVKDNSRKDTIEVGDIKQSGDIYPQCKFIQWNNETNFSIRYKHDIKDATVEVTDDYKFIWKSADQKKECHIYQIDSEKAFDSEDGGIEIEVILNEKPNSNVIEYTLQTKGLNFFYQGDLTDEEKNETFIDRDGIIRNKYIRPWNVVGSYAVYHKSEKHNEYGTGKAFHIYRPVAINADGDGVFCDLNIDEKNDLLTITIPQDFLDKSNYPITVDPTFGYTSVGATYNEDNSTLDAYASLATLPVKGDISSISAYMSSDTSSFTLHFKGVIWSKTSPYSVVTNGVGGDSGTVNSTPAWFTSSYSTHPELTADDYYLGIVWDEINDGYLRFRYDNTTGENYRIDTSNSYSSPQELGSGSTSGTTRIYSVYATYTEIIDYPSIGIDDSDLSFSVSPPISGKNPDAQTVTITNNGDSGTTLNWSAEVSDSWILIDTTSGSINYGDPGDEINVDIDVSQLSDYQEYNGSVTITDSTADNSPQVISVYVSTESLWNEQLHARYGTDSTNELFFSDNFDDNSIDSGIWTENDYGGTGTNTETGQQLVQVVDSTSGSDYVDLTQTGPITGQFDVSVKLVDYEGSNGSHSLHIYKDSNEYVIVGFVSGSFVCNRFGGSTTVTPTPSTPVWVRVIRGLDGYCDVYYSTNESDWTLIIADIQVDGGCYIALYTQNTVSSSTSSPNTSSASDQGDRSYSWTNVSNTYNGSTSNYGWAYCRSGSYSNTLRFTSNAAPGSGGTITKVEIGVAAADGGSWSVTLKSTPVFNGTTSGDTYTDSNILSVATYYYHDITNSTNAPSTWTWSDIQNLDIDVYGIGSVSFSSSTCNVYNALIRVTYVDSIEDATTTWDDFENRTFQVYTVEDINAYTTITDINGVSFDKYQNVKKSDGTVLYIPLTPTSSNPYASRLKTYDPIDGTTALYYMTESYVVNPGISSDNFDDNSLDTGIWTATDADSGTGSGALSEQNNRIEISGSTGTTLPSRMDQFISQTGISGRFDVSVKVTSMYSSDDTYTDNNAYLIATNGSTEVFRILITNINDTKLVAWLDLAGSVNSSTPYSWTLPVWLRIRYDETNITLYYSENESDWTSVYTVSHSSDLSIIRIGGALANTTAANYTGYIYLDDFKNKSIQY